MPVPKTPEITHSFCSVAEPVRKCLLPQRLGQNEAKKIKIKDEEEKKQEPDIGVGTLCTGVRVIYKDSPGH